jgi:hypothetical protein
MLEHKKHNVLHPIICTRTWAHGTCYWCWWWYQESWQKFPTRFPFFCIFSALKTFFCTRYQTNGSNIKLICDDLWWKICFNCHICGEYISAESDFAYMEKWIMFHFVGRETDRHMSDENINFWRAELFSFGNGLKALEMINSIYDKLSHHVPFFWGYIDFYLSEVQLTSFLLNYIYSAS